MTQVTASTLSGFSVVDDMITTTRWSADSISFGFTNARSDYDAIYGIGEANRGLQELTERQKEAARDAMDLWDELIDLSLSETVGKDADIRIAQSSAPATAWAYTPSSRDEAGDAWFGTGRGYFTNPEAGNYGMYTFLHEFGHSLGLQHPHEGFFIGRSGARDTDNYLGLGANAVVSPVDAMAYSVMSYSSFVGDGKGGYTNATWDYAQTPMLRDIASVQHLYGANYETRSDDTVYSWNERTGEKSINGVGQGAPGGNTVFETLWDGNGRDTLDLSAYQSDVALDLNPGSWSKLASSQVASLGSGNVAPGSVALAYLHKGDERSLIENAIGGAGDDTLSGNVANNVLVGGAGSDRIIVTEGNNILAGGGIGEAFALLGLSLPSYLSTGTPQSAQDGDDELIGGNGNDVFIASRGNDTVEGGDGLNTLVIETNLAAVSIVEQGQNLVFSYDGLEITTTGIDYVALQDGIFGINGTDAPVAGQTQARTGDAINLVYNAGLNRDIDTDGLNHWTTVLNTGGSIDELAHGVVSSDEFKTNFGDPSTTDDEQFVQTLYSNVLDREGDEGGVSHWVGELEDGQTRADVLVSFSLSQENRDAVAAQQAENGEEPQIGVDLIAVGQQHWADTWYG